MGFLTSTQFLLISQILEWMESKFMNFYDQHIKINAHTNRKMKLYMIRGEALTNSRYLLVSAMKWAQENMTFNHTGMHRSIFL